MAGNFPDRHPQGELAADRRVIATFPAILAHSGGSPSPDLLTRGEGDFQTLLKQDAEVKTYLGDAEIAEKFDLVYHLKHVDTIFNRVFGEA